MLNAIAFSVVLLAGLGLFLYQVWGRFNLLRAATGPFTLDRIPERIRAMLVYAFGQEKFIRPEVAIVKERTAGWLHFIVFWGFVILGIQIVTMFGRAFIARLLSLPVHARACSAGPTGSCATSSRSSVFVCILILLARWLVTQPRRLFGYPPAEERHRHHSHWEAYLILGCIGDDHVLGSDLRRQPAARARCRRLHRRRALGAVLVPDEPDARRRRRCRRRRRRPATSPGGCTTSPSW